MLLIAICHPTPYHPSIISLPNNFYYSFIYFVCLLYKTLLRLYYETLQRFPEQSYCLFIRFPNYYCLDFYNFSFCSCKITWKIIFSLFIYNIHNYLFIYLEKWAENALIVKALMFWGGMIEWCAWRMLIPSSVAVVGHMKWPT